MSAEMTAEEKLARAHDLIDNLTRETDAFLNAVGGGASPSKATAKKPDKKDKKRRMAENEEDEQLMESGMNDLETTEAAPTRLSVQPSNIKFGTMRAYQIEGLNWMIRLWKSGLSGILADEMGLGKTLQTISLLAYLKQYQNNNGPHLVVVPLSVLGNWIREFTRWCPSLRLIRFHGTKTDRQDLIAEMKAGEFDVCVTSYEMIVMEKHVFAKCDWVYMVVDEAHRLKNENSVLSQVLRGLPSKFRLLITGTPLQNNLHELWALLNFLLPKIFSSSDEFDAIFEINESTSALPVMDKLHQLLRPFMLRRLKVDVEKSLPPKKETIVFVGMSELQKKLYRSVLLRDIDAVNGNCKQKNRLLNLVMQLRKAANHPYLFDGVEDRSLDPFGDHVVENAGKLVVLAKLLVKLQMQGSRVLIFSQMTRMLDILEDFCLSFGYKYCRIDGSTSTDNRESQMDVFNEPNSEKFVFLLSTRAGGLGINLATADIVILFDSDWNPQMDLQAQDRAHRIGQKKAVQVYRFVTEHTIEERIVERAELKLRLDAMVIQRGSLSRATKAIDKDEMQDMIRYGADEIFRSKESTITDEDIDMILSKGEAKTSDLNAKLTANVGSVLTAFSMDGTSEDADIQDIMSMNRPATADEKKAQLDQKRIQEFELLAKINDAIGKRDRKVNQSYDVNAYYREALASNAATKCLVAKPKKLVRMGEWQFYNVARIMELTEKEEKFYLKHKDNPDPPALRGITDEEYEERERLLTAEAFPEWSRPHFFSFIRACETFGRADIENIIVNVKGKTPMEVRMYHKVFFSDRGMATMKNAKHLQKKIEEGESKVNRNREYNNSVHEILKYFNNDVNRLMDELVFKTKGQSQKYKGFTLLADRYLLAKSGEIGYGKWEDLAEEVAHEPDFCFDYFLLSRTPTELQRRVEILIRASQHLLEEPAVVASVKADAACGAEGAEGAVANKGKKRKLTGKGVVGQGGKGSRPRKANLVLPSSSSSSSAAPSSSSLAALPITVTVEV